MLAGYGVKEDQRTCGSERSIHKVAILLITRKPEISEPRGCL